MRDTIRCTFAALLLAACGGTQPAPEVDGALDESSIETSETVLPSELLLPRRDEGIDQVGLAEVDPRIVDPPPHREG